MSDSTPQASSEEASLKELSAFARRLAVRLVGNGADAEDVAQEAILSAWVRWPGALSTEGPRNWIARCVRNGAGELGRRGRARRAREREVSQSESGGAAPDAELLAIERQRRLLDLVAGLPPEFRSALVERFLNGKSVKDAAVQLDVPEETLRTRTRRGLKLLRSRIQDREGGHDASGLPCLAWLAILAAPGPAPVQVAAATALPVTQAS